MQRMDIKRICLIFIPHGLRCQVSIYLALGSNRNGLVGPCCGEAVWKSKDCWVSGIRDPTVWDGARGPLGTSELLIFTRASLRESGTSNRIFKREAGILLLTTRHSGNCGIKLSLNCSYLNYLKLYIFTTQLCDADFPVTAMVSASLGNAYRVSASVLRAWRAYYSILPSQPFHGTREI